MSRWALPAFAVLSACAPSTAPRTHSSALDSLLAFDAFRGSIVHSRIDFVATDAFRVRLPGRASDALRVWSPSNPTAYLDVTPEGLEGVAFEPVNGALVARDAAPALDVVLVGAPGRVEELRLLRSQAAPSVARYRLRAGPAITAIRAREGRVETVDAEGAIVFRTDPIFAVDAQGRRRDLTLALDGDRLTATLDTRDLAFPIAVDPTWSTTGAMGTKRYFPFGSNFALGAALLPSGKILVAGGHDGTTVLASSELYDPATSSWAPAGSLSGPRISYLVPLLSGKVLMAGGQVAASDCTYSAATEVFDPASNNWTVVAPMKTRRDPGLIATRLNDGRVLVSGGGTSCGGYTATTEIYDPTSNTWSDAAAMSGTRAGHAAVTLSGGKVLVAGGNGAAGKTTAEVFDPSANTWTLTGPMISGRIAYATATLLPGDKALVAGGLDSTNQSTAEVYSLTTNSWTAAKAMSVARSGHAALPFGSGVLVIGGASSVFHSSAELYEPSTDTWSPAGALNTPRNNLAAVRLASGSVLVTGGVTAGGVVLTSTEIGVFGSALGTACAAGSECASGLCVDGNCCNSACDTACHVCNAPGKAGTCSPVDGVADPRGKCPTGGCNGSCNAGACGFAASTAACGTGASCSGSLFFAASHCSGTDATCVTPTAVSCPGGFACGGSVCKTSCTVDSDCASGLGCTASSCGAKPDAGVDAAPDTSTPDTSTADTSPDTSTPDTSIDSGAGLDSTAEDTLVADTTSVTDSGPKPSCDPALCAPYVCGGDGKCLRDCTTSSECAAGNLCNSARKCEPPTEAPDDGACGCSTPGRESRAGLAALLPLLLVAVRRRRAVAPKSTCRPR